MLTKRLVASAAALSLAAGIAVSATPAQAQWRRGWGGPGPFIGGAILGLGVGALLTAPYYARPPVVYAPPRAYYPPPAYAYAPRPYYAPYGYGYAPGYYVR